MRTSLAFSLAAEVRAEMARQKLSGRRFAMKIGVPPSTLGRWTSGETPFSLDDIDLVAEGLDVTVSTLLDRAEGNRDGDPGGGHTKSPYVDSPVLTLVAA